MNVVGKPPIAIGTIRGDIVAITYGTTLGCFKLRVCVFTSNRTYVIVKSTIIKCVAKYLVARRSEVSTDVKVAIYIYWTKRVVSMSVIQEFQEVRT